MRSPLVVVVGGGGGGRGGRTGVAKEGGGCEQPRLRLSQTLHDVALCNSATAKKKLGD